MAKNINILQELKEVSPYLSNRDIGLPFTVPSPYFQEFPEIMVELARKKDQSYSVPEGYFDHFAEKMLQQVRNLEIHDELNEVAPLLNSIAKEMPHHLPEHYFEREISIPEKQATPKVVPMFRKNLQRWAIAASVIVMLGFGWFLLDRSKQTTGAYSTVTTEEITNLLGEMDENNLGNMVEEYNIETAFSELLMLANQDVENSLQKISTDDLKNYIESHKVPDRGI